MRRFSLTALLAILPAVMLGLLLTGCGGKKGDDEDEGPSRPSKRAPRPQGDTGGEKQTPIKATEYGTITGQVTWSGDPPNVDELTKNLQAGINNDRDYCLSGVTKDGKKNPSHPIQNYEKEEQVYRIGENKGLGNVFVWIAPAESGHYFEVPQDQLAKFKDTEVVISQPHCAFLPHAAVIFPSYNNGSKQVPTGQKFVVENDAVVSHNSKVAGGPRNPGTNPTLAPKDKEVLVLKPDNTPIAVSCGIHTWMKAYVRAYDHPYASVSSVGGDIKAKKYEDPKSPKYGTYEITGVPVGAKVRIYAWHEDLGPLNGSSGEEITLQKENKKDFTAKAK
jgi:hypothetical protein